MKPDPYAMHRKPMPANVELVVPCLDHWPADAGVASVLKGGARKSPNWEAGHSGPGYTSAPGPHWIRPAGAA